MKIFKARPAGVLATGIAVAGFFAVSAAASAQYPNDYRNRGRVLESRSYERMRQYAHQLDELAQHAREQAHAQQGGYRSFRRDTKFLRSIDHFADRTDRFHEQMDTYQRQPWAVDDEIDHLIRDARNVQYRLRRARFVDQHTVEDWNNVVGLLNRMASEYRAGIGYGGRWRGNRGDQYPASPPPPGGYQEPYANRPPEDYRGQGNWRQGDLRQLAAELDERAARASQLYGGSSGYSPELSHFSTQARNFRNLVEQSRISDSELRSQVNHLLEDAQSAQQELSNRSASREVADEWNAIVQILTRMRDSV
jgi:hypothetical protein